LQSPELMKLIVFTLLSSSEFGAMGTKT